MSDLTILDPRLVSQGQTPASSARSRVERSGGPGWIALAAESLANFEALRGWGMELPRRGTEDGRS
jgi:hypothetical protein